MARLARFGKQNPPSGYRNVTGNFSSLVTKNKETGFDSRIFKSKKGKYVAAFKGLGPFSRKDWRAARRQARKGITKGQFEDADKLVRGLLDKEGIDASNLTIVGSSLGGALAAYAGSKHNIRTITFNAAGLHPNNVGPYADMVTNYVMRKDWLTGIQESTPLLPDAIGAQIMVEPAPIDIVFGVLTLGVSRHYLGRMQRGLKRAGR